MRPTSTLLDSRHVLHESGVHTGMHVADFGCGRTGHFVLPASRLVGEDGRVYAVDISKQNLAMLHDHSAMRGAVNVHPVWGDYEAKMGVAIPEYSLDRIFFVNNIPLLAKPRELSWELRRLLAPDGKFIVLDWHSWSEHPAAPARHVRFDKSDAAELFDRHGFSLIDEFYPSNDHWALVFT